eukprot:403363301
MNGDLEQTPDNYKGSLYPGEYQQTSTEYIRGDKSTKKVQSDGVQRLNTKGKPIFTEDGEPNLPTIAGLNTEGALMEEDNQQKLKKLLKEKEELKSGVFRFHNKITLYSKKSLFFFNDKSVFRKVAVWLIEWNWFDRFIMFCIFANSISLSMFDYTDRDAKTQYNQILNNIGDAFTFLFLFEALVKIFAMGFIIHKKSYLRDGWNVLDFFIVVTGLVDLVATTINLKSLRTLRVMRPLRSINAIPSMRRLVSTLLQSLPELGNAAIFLFFMIILFGILGLQQFSGVMYYKCRLTEKPINGTYWPKSPDFTRVCSKASDGGYHCPEYLWCGSPLDVGISLEDDGVYNDNQIQFGISSFDNFGQAVLGVFQTISKDGWADLMYNMSDGSNYIFARIYFCFIIVFGSFFLLNLILAVIMANFTRISQIDEENELIKKEKLFKQDKKINFEKLTTEDILNMSSSEGENAIEEFQAFQEQEEKIRTLGMDSYKSSQMTKSKTLKRNKINLEVEQLDGSQEVYNHKLTTPNNKQSYRDTLPLKDIQDQTPVSNNNLNAPPTPMSHTPYSAMLIQQKGGKQHGEDFTSSFGLAMLQKTLEKDPQHFQKATTSLKQFQELEIQMHQADQIEDKGERLKVQQKMFVQQKRVLEKMELDIKKKYAQSKRRIYGIDNEQEIVTQIKKGIKSEILKQETEQRILDEEEEDSTPKKMLRQRENDEVEKQLDQVCLIALKICSNLKQLNLKQHLQEVILQKFKSQLIQKNILEKMNNQVDSKMTQNILTIRAQKTPVYGICLRIATHPLFNLLIICAIVCNAVVLAMDRYPQSDGENKLLDFFNLAFFTIFGVELVLKLTGLGLTFYFKDKFNLFDSIVVFVSMIDITLQYASKESSVSGGAISALRVFRVIRIFQLAKIWKNFQNLLRVISNTVKDISNISILIFLFIFTYTLLGMDLFAYQLRLNEIDSVLTFSDDALSPQSTFNSFIRSFISVFIVLANDGWTNIYFDHYRAVGSITASFYFISLMIIGQYILLNLFIAILIENFEQVSVHQDTVNKLNQGQKQLKSYEVVLKFIYKCFRKEYKQQDDSEIAQLIRKKEDDSQQKTPSLYIFKNDNKIRKFCKKYTTHKKFESVMLFIILISSVQLAVDNPLNDPESIVSSILGNVDIILTTIFTLECVMKIVGFGYINCGSTSYIRSGWNILDFIVVFLSIVSMMVSSKNINSIKILRLLKVLRPLRVISRNQGLKISLRSLGKAVPGIINVSIISLVFYLIFGIIGVNYFKGVYYYCETDHLIRSNMLIMTMDSKWDCISLGGEWKKYFQNFDNIFEAIGTLFTISTAVDWSEVMYRGASARGIDLSPKDMNSQSSAIFFIAFMIVGNFFLLNLFVGVVISTYNREKEVLGRNFLLTEKQRKWLENKIMMVQSKPMLKMKLPANEWRQPFFILAEFKWFERFIYFCIIANTVILSIQWQNQPQVLDVLTEKVNYAFAGIFTFEVIVKFLAYGKRYFKDGWNNFDIVIVIMTLISILLAATTSYQLGPQTTIIRSFRIGRIFKLFRRNKSLKSIFQTFLVTLPAMANVGSLLVLFIFIYSILGVYIFADIKLSGKLTENANFQNVSNAFLLLVRISTGENWSKLMNSLQQSYNLEYQCVDSPVFQDYQSAGYNTVGCGSFTFPIIYFYSYILVVQLIYLKLFIAIILQGFQDTTERDNKLLDQEASDRFREVWANYDPDGTTFMSSQSYGLFLERLGQPLGWELDYTYNYLKQLNYLDEVSLPKYNAGKDYQFMDVFESLALLMIVKKEVKKYLVKYSRKVQMIQQRKEIMDQKKREELFRKKHRVRKPTMKNSGKLVITPKLNKQATNNFSKKELPKQGTIKDINKDLKIKKKQQQDTMADSTYNNSNTRTKNGGRLDTNLDDLLYHDTDQHQEELKNQLRSLIQTGTYQPSDTQLQTTTNQNSRMTTQPQGFGQALQNNLPRQSNATNYNYNMMVDSTTTQLKTNFGEMRSDLNEDDIEAQIDALLQNNSLMNDLEMKLNQQDSQQQQQQQTQQQQQLQQQQQQMIQQQQQIKKQQQQQLNQESNALGQDLMRKQNIDNNNNNYGFTSTSRQAQNGPNRNQYTNQNVPKYGFQK